MGLHGAGRRKKENMEPFEIRARKIWREQILGEELRASGLGKKGWKNYIPYKVAIEAAFLQVPSDWGVAFCLAHCRVGWMGKSNICSLLLPTGLLR